MTTEEQPGPKVRSDDEWLAFVREYGETVFHPTSTCRMGTVLDEKLRVKGVDGLRVVDASIIPEVPSSTTNVTVIMLAERIAQQVYGRRPA